MTHVEYMPDGSYKRIMCKVCGDCIAMHEGSTLIRKDHYAEVKIRFDDGSYHVTNGCKYCLGMSMSLATLKMVYEMDCQDDPSIRGERNPEGVIAASYDQKGII